MNTIKIGDRLIGLDLFRIAAAIIVMAFHSNVHFGCNYGWMNEFIKMGAIMMTGFFMLSGFSLYYSYHNRNLLSTSSLKSFYKKRLLSILPLYYTAALIYILLTRDENIFDYILLAPAELLCIQSFYPNSFSLIHNGGTWFISCIMVCYMLFPFAVSSVKNLNMKYKLALIVLLTMILLYSPILVYRFQLGNIYSNPFFRLLEFLIGVLLAAFLLEIPDDSFISTLFSKKFLLVMEIIFLIVTVTLAVRSELYIGNYMMYSWITIPVFLFMFPSLAIINWGRLYHSKIILYLSEISYGFYLVQLFIWEIMRKITNFMGVKGNLPKIVLSYVVCFCIAVVMHEWIERPIRRKNNQ